MPMKAECMSLVCRMVKVFLPSAAARPAGSAAVAPAASVPARNSRRASASIDMDTVIVLFRRRSQPLVLHQRAVAQLGHDIVQVEAGGLLPLRVLLEARQELADILLRRNQQ